MGKTPYIMSGTYKPIYRVIPSRKQPPKLIFRNVKLNSLFHELVKSHAIYIGHRKRIEQILHKNNTPVKNARIIVDVLLAGLQNPKVTPRQRYNIITILDYFGAQRVKNPRLSRYSQSQVFKAFRSMKVIRGVTDFINGTQRATHGARPIALSILGYLSMHLRTGYGKFAVRNLWKVYLKPNQNSRIKKQARSYLAPIYKGRTSTETKRKFNRMALYWSRRHYPARRTAIAGQRK